LSIRGVSYTTGDDYDECINELHYSTESDDASVSYSADHDMGNDGQNITTEFKSKYYKFNKYCDSPIEIPDAGDETMFSSMLVLQMMMNKYEDDFDNEIGNEVKYIYKQYQSLTVLD
jgi:subtilase family serine protease